MDERKEEGDWSYAPGTEDEVRQGELPNGWGKDGHNANLCKVAKLKPEEEANNRAGAAARTKGPKAGDLSAWPTGEPDREGVVATQKAANTADVEGDEGFYPSHLWLLLERVGCKVW